MITIKADGKKITINPAEVMEIQVLNVKGLFGTTYTMVIVTEEVTIRIKRLSKSDAYNYAHAIGDAAGLR